MWKFHNFSTSQILREIIFWDSSNSKSAILTHSEALNSDFYEFVQFLEAEIYQVNKNRSPKIAKKAILRLLDSTKLVSRKI